MKVDKLTIDIDTDCSWEEDHYLDLDPSSRRPLPVHLYVEEDGRVYAETQAYGSSGTPMDVWEGRTKRWQFGFCPTVSGILKWLEKNEGLLLEALNGDEFAEEAIDRDLMDWEVDDSCFSYSLDEAECDDVVEDGVRNGSCFAEIKEDLEEVISNFPGHCIFRRLDDDLKEAIEKLQERIALEDED